MALANAYVCTMSPTGEIQATNRAPGPPPSPSTLPKQIVLANLGL